MLIYLSNVEEGGETVFQLEGAEGLARLDNINYKNCNEGIKVRSGGGWRSCCWCLMRGGGVRPCALALWSGSPAIHSRAACLPACLPALQVKPRQGDAILFHSAHVNGTFDRHSLHGACPVVHGTKWSMAKWLRNQGQY